MFDAIITLAVLWFAAKVVLFLVRRAEELAELETDARAAEIRTNAKK